MNPCFSITTFGSHYFDKPVPSGGFCIFVMNTGVLNPTLYDLKTSVFLHTVFHIWTVMQYIDPFILNMPVQNIKKITEK